MVQDDYLPSIEKEVKSIRTALSTFRQEEKLVKIRSRVVILWDYIEKSGKMGYKTYTVDQLKEIRKLFPVDSELTDVMGDVENLLSKDIERRIIQEAYKT